MTIDQYSYDRYHVRYINTSSVLKFVNEFFIHAISPAHYSFKRANVSKRVFKMLLLE